MATFYPFKPEHLDVPEDEIGYYPEVDRISNFNFWGTENVPYKTTSYQEIDTNTGELLQEIDYPEVLQDTVFFALNSMACYTDNTALYN